MVVAIVFIVTIGTIIKARYNSKAGIIEDEHGNQRFVAKEDNKALIEEVQNLRERVKVLERVITDGRQSTELAREIEDLRKG